MLDPHTMSIAVATLGVGWLMVYAALGKSALELRQKRRICPSCGRRIQARVCTCCT
jgi:hypothetical protein